MRILMLTASLPYPPASGGAIRTYGIIKGLHEAGHALTLLSFDDRDSKPEQTPLAQYCQHIETLLPPHRSKLARIRDMALTRQPDIAKRFYSETYHQRLLEILKTQPFDLIQFEAIEMGCYLPIVHQANTGAKLCFDTFNAEAELQRVIYTIDRQEMKRWPAALYSFIQSRRIKKYEGDLCRMADCVIAVSPEDHAILSAYRQDDHTYIVPSGITVDGYQTVESSIELKPNAIVFTGKMDYRPNVDAMLWFTEAIFPQIIEKIPDSHLVIVGQKPHPRLQHLNDNPRITITGWVDAVPPYLHATDVYIAPLRMGSGTRLKILEAMASGCALVVTNIAASGLLSDAKDAMIVADTESATAEAVIQLLQNPSTRQQLGEQARHAVKQHYDWSVLIPRLLAAYREIGLG